MILSAKSCSSNQGQLVSSHEFFCWIAGVTSRARLGLEGLGEPESPPTYLEALVHSSYCLRHSWAASLSMQRTMLQTLPDAPSHSRESSARAPNASRSS